MLIHPERTLPRRGRGDVFWVEIHDRAATGLRSNESNAYLWGVVYAAVAAATGNDPRSVHYGLKREAVKVGILEAQYVPLGNRLIEDEPTTRVDTDEFWRYVNWIRHEAEHGTLTGTPFHIPEPNEDAETPTRRLEC